MSITILIERNGIRAYRTVYDSLSTRIPGVSKIHWHGAPTRTDREYFSLVHTDTGRALNKVPLTTGEADRLVDALVECPIEWDEIVNGRDWPGVPHFTERLTDEARRLAGVY
jgi:hypothetical protein